MKYSKIMITVWLCIIGANIIAQDKSDSSNLGTLQFKETKTFKIVDYKVTITQLDNDDRRQIIDRTSKKFKLADGRYRVAIETIPEANYTIELDSGTLYEIQINRQGIVNISNSKLGTLELYEVRKNFEVKEPFKTIIQIDKLNEIVLSEGLYRVVRKIRNSPDKELFFEVVANKKISIEF